MSDCPHLRESRSTEGVIVCRLVCDALGWEVGSPPQSCEGCERSLDSAPLRRMIGGYFRMRIGVDWDLHERFPDRVKEGLPAAVRRGRLWLESGEIEDALIKAVRRGLDPDEAGEMLEATGRKGQDHADVARTA